MISQNNFNQICYEFQVYLVPLAAVTCRVPQVGPKWGTTQTSTTLHPNMGTWAWPECTPHLPRCTPRVALRVIMGIRQEPLIIGLMGRRCQSRGLQGVPVEKICLLILQVCNLLKVAFFQKVRFLFQISKSPEKNIPKNYPELEI